MVSFDEATIHEIRNNTLTSSAYINACEDNMTDSAWIGDCGRAGRVQHVVVRFDGISIHKVGKNEISYSACICACEKRQQWRTSSWMRRGSKVQGARLSGSACEPRDPRRGLEANRQDGILSVRGRAFVGSGLLDANLRAVWGVRERAEGLPGRQCFGQNQSSSPR